MNQLVGFEHQSSDCGSDGKAVALNARGPWFDSIHRQLLQVQLITFCLKDENNEKETEEESISSLKYKGPI